MRTDSAEMPIPREALDVVLRLFDDRRALIAAGKLQRWEVAKWAVTANFALGAASVGVGELQVLFFGFSCVIAAMAWILLWHYNLRMTKVRESLRSINSFLNENVININEIGKADFVRTKDTEYDVQEMYIFYTAAIVSTFPALITIWVNG